MLRSCLEALTLGSLSYIANCSTCQILPAACALGGYGFQPQAAHNATSVHNLR